MKELLNSSNIKQILRALECLPSEKISKTCLENLEHHNDRLILDAVKRHSNHHKQDNVNQKLSLASLKIEQGDINEAHWILEEMITEASENSRYLYIFAQAKQELNDIKGARKLLQKSLQINQAN